MNTERASGLVEDVNLAVSEAVTNAVNTPAAAPGGTSFALR